MKNQKSVQELLETMFQTGEEYFSIIFENASPSTTTKLVVKERDSVEKYFSLMKDSGFITSYTVNKRDFNGDWSVVFKLRNHGSSKYTAKIQSLQYCQI